MDSAAPEDRGGRPLLRNAGHLAALWGLAVVQPTFGLLSDGDNPAYFFVGRRVEGLQFVVVAVVFVLLPLALAIALEALAGRIGERARSRLHAVLVWGLSSLLALYALERALRDTAESPNGALVLMAGAALLGALLTALYLRWSPLGSVLSVLSPFPLLALLLFLFASPASGLVFGEGDPAEPLSLPASDTPVVMVVFDELPVATLMDARGNIDSERFPAFAELAGRGTWFRNTVAAADDTVQALPALLTSRLPNRGDAPVHTAAPRSVFTAFARSHRMTGMEHATWLCPPEVCPEPTSGVARMARAASALSMVYPNVIIPPGLYSKLGVGKPDIGRTWGEALRPERPERSVDELIRLTGEQPVELNRYADAQFERFVRLVRADAKASQGAENGERAPFYFLHTSLPHVPWVHLPDGRVYADLKEALAGLGGQEQWGPDAAAVERAWQRHLLQARFADLSLGRLLDELRDQGLYDRALVLVTADHGSSFVPGGNRRFVSAANAADVAMVPLIVKSPRQRSPRVVERALQSIDVLPTLAELLDVNLPWELEGRSALDGPGREKVQISSFLNDPLVTEVAELERGRAQTLKRQGALFGDGLEGGAGFGMGPARDLVGRRVDATRLGPPLAGDTRLLNASAFESVDLGSRWLPAARTVGYLSGTEEPVRWVAAAVGGRVAAVGPTSSWSGVQGFVMPLQPSVLRQGRNRVELYAVEGTGRRLRLRPLEDPVRP